MSTGQADVTVIVCSFNGSDRLRRFLADLDAQRRIAVCETELLVVDDGSTDGTAMLAASLAPEARIVRVHDNRGLPAARNTGARTAGGDWLLYCDDDVVLSAHAISELWRRRKEGTCLVPVVTGPSGAIQNSVTLEFIRGDPKFRFHSAPVLEVAFPVGSCFLVSRQDYDRAGGCDERFFPMYYDDAALGARLRQTGTTIAMATDIVVEHFEHGDQKEPARRLIIDGWVYRHRWTYVLVALRGRQRAVAIFLGLPRVALESIRKRSVRPFAGYLGALGAVPHLLKTADGRRESRAAGSKRGFKRRSLG